MREREPALEPAIDVTQWSGEGEFTEIIIDRLRRERRITHLRVEDAAASRAEADYSLVSNELYVRFSSELRREPGRLWGVVPVSRRVAVPSLTLPGLEALLAADRAIGAPDYADEGMLQYLRTQRIVPPYQNRGYKLVELVRIYVAGSREAR